MSNVLIMMIILGVIILTPFAIITINELLQKDE